MRKRARVDTNQAEIVAALRKVGCSVQPIHTVGGGTPDLLVGVRGVNLLLEVKDGSKRPSEQYLTPAEAAWHFGWRGLVCVVSSVDEALALVNRA